MHVYFVLQKGSGVLSGAHSIDLLIAWEGKHKVELDSCIAYGLSRERWLELHPCGCQQRV